MAARGRRPVPVELRLAVTGFYVIGGILVVLSLMATGVLLSGMQVDPAEQGGTGYLDFVLFFNAMLCLAPLAVLLIVLGVRLTRGEHWAWLTSLVVCGFVGTTVPFLAWILPAPMPFGVVPMCCAAVLIGLLLAPGTRLYCQAQD